MLRRPPRSTLFPTRRSSDLRGERGRQVEQQRRAVLQRVEVDDAVHRVVAVVRVQRRSEEHTSELQSQSNLVCRLLLEKKKKKHNKSTEKLIIMNKVSAINL